MGCFGLLTFLPPRDDKHHSIQYGELAQLGERLVCNQEVTGSSPVFSTNQSLGMRSPKGLSEPSFGWQAAEIEEL